MRTDHTFNIERFLEQNYHGMTMQSFWHIPDMVGVSMYCPWGEIGMVRPLDLQRIRHGEPKYIVQEAFRTLSGDCPVPEKIPFTRPDYLRAGFYTRDIPFLRKDIDIPELSAQQRWMLFCLCNFYRVARGNDVRW